VCLRWTPITVDWKLSRPPTSDLKSGRSETHIYGLFQKKKNERGRRSGILIQKPWFPLKIFW
jgi:hypothetical protein